MAWHTLLDAVNAEKCRSSLSVDDLAALSYSTPARKIYTRSFSIILQVLCVVAKLPMVEVEK